MSTGQPVERPRRVALTVDLEEWNDGIELPPGRVQVLEDTAWLLDLFASTGVHATFFTLGDLARRHPELVARVHAAGHEIGCHGATHTWLHELGPQRFRRGMQEAVATLEAITGEAVAGFRAPFFSLTDRTPWAFDVLKECGLTYDASLYPGHNDRYGWPGAPQQPARHRGTGLAVFPVPLHRRLRVAFSGGAYLRILPWPVIRQELRSQADAGATGMVYVHPWEVAERLPWEREAALRSNLTRHVGRPLMRRRLEHVLSLPGVQFNAMRDVLGDAEALPVWDPSRSA